MDYEKAIADGHKPEEVMGELARRGVKMDYKRALADKHDPMEVLKEMNSRLSGDTAPTANKIFKSGDTGSQRDVMGVASRDERSTPVVFPSRKSIAKIARPILEGGGMVAGGIAGVGAGALTTGGVASPLLGLAGTALGYGMGSQAADIIEGPSATQVKLPVNLNELRNPQYRPRTAGEEVGNVVNKLKTGVELDMGGQVVGNLAGRTANLLLRQRAKGVPLSDKRAQYKSAQEFATSQESSAPAAEQNALRQGETDRLLNRLGTTAKPTPGQASGNYKSAALEQSMSSKDPAFAEGLSYNDAELRKAATSNLTGALGRPKELPRTPPRDVTGANIVTAIETSKAPVRATEKQLYSEVPDYPMPAENFITAGKSILGSPMPRDTKKIVKDMLDYAKDVPHTVEGLQSIEKSIKGAISKANRAGDANTARVLGQMKEAVAADFTALGEAADRGDIMVSNGKVIIPSRMKADIASLEEQITKEQIAPISLKDRNTHLNEFLSQYGNVDGYGTLHQTEAAANKVLTDRLAELQKGNSAGVQPLKTWEQWKADNVVKAEQYKEEAGRFPWEGDAKLKKEYSSYVRDNSNKANVDYTPPSTKTTASTNPLLDNLTARRADLQATLAAAKPAEDVAAAYSAAKRYSKEEKFDRFYRGAVADVLKTGEQATGRQITNEQVPGRFFTRQGSKDLSVSLMPVKGTLDPVTGEVLTLPERIAAGRAAAAEQLIPHVTEQLISKTVDANTGVMNIPRAMAYMRQNADVLHELGLTRSVQQVIKGQVPRAIEAELERQGVDIIGNPSMTALQAKKMITRMGPAVRKLYGEPAMQALTDYGQMMEILGRNKNVSYAKGSTTAEKLSGDMLTKMGENAAGLLAVTGGHGWVFSAVKNLVKGMFEPALKMQREAMNKILQEALTNPAAAEALMKIARAKPADVSVTATRVLTPFIRQMGVAVTQPPDAQPEGRADGGPVNAGQPYVMGERRPELLVQPQGATVVGANGPQIVTPQQSGVVIPQVPDDYSAWYSKLEAARGKQAPGYDTEGWYSTATPKQREEVLADPKKHMKDTYKLPNHITFSTDSKYSTPETPGGEWKEVGGKWHYKPSDYVLKTQGVDKLKWYFKKH